MSILKPILCSNCFKDYGLRIMAERMGPTSSLACPNCGSTDGVLLDEKQVEELCDKYFVDGSYNSTCFGGSPLLIMHKGSHCIDTSIIDNLHDDIHLIHAKTGLTADLYGPDLWRVGITEWMDRLLSRSKKKRDGAIEELISRCNIKLLPVDSEFFRIRAIERELIGDMSFDAPIKQNYKKGRFNIRNEEVFYASFDVETCIHECRASMEDVLYVATLKPCKILTLLDMSDIQDDNKEITPFEDLQLAVSQIFGAGVQSYCITRRISEVAKEHKLDGIIYPSYYNSVRDYSFKNIVLFGHVIRNGVVRVKSIDRVQIRQVDYKYDYGPVLNT